jgi:signal transduction histidine kinase/ligand-binding sensor domain-containing protein/ActR/RegA family two-component response regulator
MRPRSSIRPLCCRASRAFGAFASLLLLLPLLPAQHVAAIADAAPWIARSWDATSGLPQNTVAAVVQGRDGMLWVATYGGLCRFDGADWTIFDPASTRGFSDSRIVSLAEGDDGSLWIGSELGIVSRYDGDRFCAIASLGTGPVRHLTKLRDGRIVCGCADDLYVVDAALHVARLLREPLADSTALLALPDGDALATGSFGVRRVHGDQAEVLDSAPAHGATRAADGTVWFGGPRGLLRLRDGRVESADELMPPALSHRDLRDVFVSRSGWLWFGTLDTIGCVSLAGERAPMTFATKAPLQCLHEDSAGGIWAGFVGGGLVRLSPCEAEVVAMRAADGRPVGATSVQAVGDGVFWVGTARGLYACDRGVLARIECVPAIQVQGLLRDDDGTTWLGHDRSVGRMKDGAYESLPLPAETHNVRAIRRDHRGRLLIGTEIGVFELADGSWRPFAPAASLRDPVKMIVPWANGELWIVGQHGLLHLAADGSTLRQYTLGADLPLAEVRAVFAGRGDRAWLATYGAGFVGIDRGGLTLVGPEQGLTDAYLCSAVAFGERWLIGGNRGPYLVDPRELDRVADRTATHVTCRTIVCPRSIPAEANGGVQPSIAARDGAAAICGVGGLWLVDEHRLRHDRPAPICHVHALLAGDQRLERRDGERTVAMGADRTIVVECTAPEFENPQGVAFQWRLADGVWSESLPRKSISIVLPGPGSFVAEFVATGPDGTTCKVPTRLALVVEPFAWERPGVLFAGIAAAAAIAFLVFRVGSRRSERQAAQLRVLVDARTRELTQARDLLEQRVAQRTAQLQSALEQLESDHAQLEQMRRMESLGQLAGSVAHDFNNLLTVVLGNAQLLALELRDHASARELTQRVLDAAARGRQMTQRLLTVASRQAVLPRVLDLGEALRVQRGVLGDLMGDLVRVELHVADEPLRVLAASGQIDQILMNLAVNARDALPRGGTFAIRADRQGDLVRLVVQDDGAGMAPDVLRRAFEPFFTTRRPGGTGLGLATVYGITKQLQGEVAIDSAPEQGTTFTFTFPYEHDETDAAAGEHEVVVPRPEPPSQRRRVLLVEDEPDVRRASRLLLENWGCAVVAECASGGDAVRWLAESAAAVDAVVSDVRMPGLTGVELARALRAIRPDLPIVFVSGHASSGSFVAELEPLGIELVNKPPARDEMMPAIERAIQRTRGATRAS